VKHSHARKVTVSLDRMDNHIRLRVEDDGDGFRSSALKGSVGLGVASMRERVELANGKLSINSEPGKGTKVFAEVLIDRRGGLIYES
ncbi:MAG TPA: ATP-binding protein, partial [Bryobacteraceae bacterium]|nr:ATP-binding protein [Bryobacteraceae bacterium]